MVILQEWCVHYVPTSEVLDLMKFFISEVLT